MTIPNPIGAENLAELGEKIGAFLFDIGVTLGVIATLWSAFLFMTSGGNPEKVQKAKSALTWTVVGIGIILIGQGIVATINSFLQ